MTCFTETLCARLMPELARQQGVVLQEGQGEALLRQLSLGKHSGCACAAALTR